MIVFHTKEEGSIVFMLFPSIDPGIVFLDKKLAHSASLHLEV